MNKQHEMRLAELDADWQDALLNFDQLMDKFRAQTNLTNDILETAICYQQQMH